MIAQQSSVYVLVVPYFIIKQLRPQLGKHLYERTTIMLNTIGIDTNKKKLIYLIFALVFHSIYA